MKAPKLPNKLSDLILVAVADLEDVEKDERYKVHMGDWHHPERDGKCFVCLAGSVMAKRLKAIPSAVLWPESFDKEIEKKLVALDDVRNGCLKRAAHQISGLFNRFVTDNIIVTPYAESPERFKLEMVLTAAALKEIGL